MQLDLCNSAPADWERLPIEAICQRFTSGGTPSRKLPEFFAGGIPWVKTQELTDCLLQDSEEHITDSAIANSSAKLLPSNTVLMAMYGATVGQLCVLARPMTCNQACAAMVVDEVKVDYRFLYYQLLASRDQIKSLSTGAAQQNLSGAQIKQFVLPYPGRKVQAAIADLLWQLDRRIDLLRQTNATLESIAQAIFKSWFIDFDPVRAKAEGREPDGMDAATAALFPAEFEESELGLIPKGWRAGTLGDLAYLNRHAWTQRNGPEEIEYIDLTSVKANVFDRPQRLAFIDAPSRARRALQNGDTLVGTVRPGNRSFGFIATAVAGLTASTGFAVLSPKRPSAASFVYLCVTRDENIQRLASLADGGAYPAVKPELVIATECVVPSETALAHFEALSGALLAGLAANAERAQALADLRDTLLPRLISGTLRLPEALKQAEEAPI